MLLEGKNAVIYGGGGSIGRAVAQGVRARGRERVPRRPHARPSSTRSRGRIRATGGAAETAEVDALDEAAVDAHADAIETGGIDISFNVIGLNDVQGTPLAEMAVADFMAPVDTAIRSYFLTARAAARHMIPRGGGVILTFGGEGDPIRDYSIGGLQVAFHAVEAMRRQFATELGRHGIRTVTLRSRRRARDESREPRGPRADRRDARGRDDARAAPRRSRTSATSRRSSASDKARTMTAATVNVSCGALID